MITGGGKLDAPLLIAGGGIGGLSAALALALRGFHVRVLEAEAGFAESGAGIQIGPNGSRLLRSWGLGEQLEAIAGRPCAIHLHDGLSGKRLASVPLGAEAERRYGAPYYVTERRLLLRMLLEAVRGRADVEIVPGFRLETLQCGGDGMAVLSTDGREAVGQALIGADGVHSRVRSLLFGSRDAAFAGRNAWRATAPAEAADDDDVHLWLGPHAHLVHYRCGPAGPVNAVAVTSGQAASPGWGTPGRASELTGRLRDWAPAPRRFMERFGEWMVWPLMTGSPLARWTKGAATLLGDAAHPIMPFLASGAVMAIEDAATLSAEIARSSGDAPNAFVRYEARRRPRTDLVSRAAARMGEIYHMNGAMRIARNISLSALPARRLLARNDWLYAHDAED